ncbi:hypothetical protein F2Q69_00063837 [Brassica cretica]|uniref:Uncharacterized protein n=1 Tax=Brassica cretica TaxID=69181 RepID=A0A8S9RG76_BRACR|nr:hypothetical protein F2Q69_00063837 [Brassica cretica]
MSFSENILENWSPSMKHRNMKEQMTSLVIPTSLKFEFFSKNGFPKSQFPQAWKGKSGLYAAGFTRKGLAGASADAVNIAQDIGNVWREETKRQKMRRNVDSPWNVHGWGAFSRQPFFRLVPQLQVLHHFLAYSAASASAAKVMIGVPLLPLVIPPSASVGPPKKTVNFQVCSNVVMHRRRLSID